MHIKCSEQDLECTHHTESINFFSVSKYCQRGLCDKETHHGEVVRTLLAPEPSSLKNKPRRCFSRGRQNPKRQEQDWLPHLQGLVQNENSELPVQEAVGILRWPPQGRKPRVEPCRAQDLGQLSRSQALQQPWRGVTGCAEEGALP